MRARALASAAVLLIGVLAPWMGGCGMEATDTGLDAVRNRGRLRVAMSGQYPPFNFYDEQNRLTGFDVQIAKEVAKRMGLRPELLTLRWDGILAGLEAGRYDVIIGSMAITPERQKAVDFSDPYYVSGAQVFARPGTKLAETGELDGAVIGVNLGTTYEKALREREESLKEVRTYGGIPEILVDLEAERLDGFVTDKLVGLHAIGARGTAIELAGDLLYRETIAVAMQEDQPRLREAIDQALEAMREDGTYARISRRWFGRDISKREEGNEDVTRAAAMAEAEQAADEAPASGIDLSVVVTFFPHLMRGLAVTAWLTLSGGVLALLLGQVLALMRLSGFLLLRFPAAAFIDFFRGTPLLIQLFGFYFGAPQLGLDITPLTAGILGLGLNGAAYTAEVFRSGILSVPKGQWEAGQALGMTDFKLYTRIILPQAYRISLPPLVGNLVALLKDTSLVSTITVVELTRQAQVAIGSSFRAVELYSAAAVLYFLITYPLMRAGDAIERRLSKGEAA